VKPGGLSFAYGGLYQYVSRAEAAVVVVRGSGSQSAPERAQFIAPLLWEITSDDLILLVTDHGNLTAYCGVALVVVLPIPNVPGLQIHSSGLVAVRVNVIALYAGQGLHREAPLAEKKL
jgi:hypothetical protein